MCVCVCIYLVIVCVYVCVVVSWGGGGARETKGNLYCVFSCVFVCLCVCVCVCVYVCSFTVCHLAGSPPKQRRPQQHHPRPGSYWDPEKLVLGSLLPHLLVCGLGGVCSVCHSASFMILSLILFFYIFMALKSCNTHGFRNIAPQVNTVHLILMWSMFNICLAPVSLGP